MSDVPPPPPNLSPPPGYAGYTQNLSASMPLKRIGGLATAMVVLLGIFIAGSLLQLAGISKTVDAAADYVAGDINQDEFASKIGLFGVSGLATGLVRIALIVLTIIWLFRIVKNHRSIGRQLTWAPGWAIGAWFLPPFLFILPMLVLRESWKAADPSVPPQDGRWKSGADNPLLWAWFAVFGVISTILTFKDFKLQFGMQGDQLSIAETLQDAKTSLYLVTIVGIVSAVLWALLVRAWTARHTQLTGEASAR